VFCLRLGHKPGICVDIERNRLAVTNVFLCGVRTITPALLVYF